MCVLVSCLLFVNIIGRFVDKCKRQMFQTGLKPEYWSESFYNCSRHKMLQISYMTYKNTFCRLGNCISDHTDRPEITLSASAILNCVLSDSMLPVISSSRSVNRSCLIPSRPKKQTPFLYLVGRGLPAISTITFKFQEANIF